MKQERIDLLKRVLEEGVGTDVVVQTDSLGPRTALRSHFEGLTQNQGPVCSIVPTGLTRHLVTVRFGKFAASCIEQMQSSGEEQRMIARALVESVVSERCAVHISPGQDLASWALTGPDFAIDVLVRDVADPASDGALTSTATRVMVPLMAAMAELIGYDEIPSHEAHDIEGEVTESVIHRRERSRRNRLLCLTTHGYQCKACGTDPGMLYGSAGSILEVHHLEPLSLISMPRAYNPVTDLVPLCPNCHRAVHTRRPVPYSIEELREILGRD